ncbi:hypothetical protein M0R19_09400 [Candidatus Pacearchaeota archaeon]|nr:hypothetical protein [Candidatus Pacearchaeota archaeon]
MPKKIVVSREALYELLDKYEIIPENCTIVIRYLLEEGDDLEGSIEDYLDFLSLDIFFIEINGKTILLGYDEPHLQVSYIGYTPKEMKDEEFPKGLLIKFRLNVKEVEKRRENLETLNLFKDNEKHLFEVLALNPNGSLKN